MHPETSSGSTGEKLDSKGTRRVCGCSQVAVGCLSLVGGLDILVEDSMFLQKIFSSAETAMFCISQYDAIAR